MGQSLEKPRNAVARGISDDFEKFYAEMARRVKMKANKRLLAEVDERLCLLFPPQESVAVNIEGLRLGAQPNAFEAFCAAVAPRLDRIIILWFRECALSTPDHWRAVVPLFSHKLVVINLSYNELGQKGAEIVGPALAEAKALLHFYVCHTELRSSGVAFICQGLSKCRQLRSADFSHCNISERGGLTLLTLWDELPELRCINIDGNLIPEPVSERMAAEQRTRTLGRSTDQEQTKNAKTIVVYGPNVPTRVAVADMQGRRATMEDSVLIHEACGVADWSLFAVFDGHGSAVVATFAARNLSVKLARIVQTLIGAGAEVRSVVIVDDDAPAPPRGGGSAAREAPRLRIGQIRQALTDVFQQVHADVTSFAQDCGSTALVCLLTPSYIFTANAGDTRAVLMRSNAQPVRLSVDHKGTDEVEQARVRSLGGKIRNGRIEGMLAVTRAIGDIAFVPYVSAVPEVRVRRRDMDDTYLVLACDGVWDVLSDNAAAQLIVASASLVDAAHTVRNMAFAFSSTDNISVMVVDIRPAAAVASAEAAAAADASNGRGVGGGGGAGGGKAARHRRQGSNVDGEVGGRGAAATAADDPNNPATWSVGDTAAVRTVLGGPKRRESPDRGRLNGAAADAVGDQQDHAESSQPSQQQHQQPQQPSRTESGRRSTGRAARGDSTSAAPAAAGPSAAAASADKKGKKGKKKKKKAKAAAAAAAATASGSGTPAGAASFSFTSSSDAEPAAGTGAAAAAPQGRLLSTAGGASASAGGGGGSAPRSSSPRSPPKHAAVRATAAAGRATESDSDALFTDST